MERPVFQPVGTPVEELDTPALVVDLDVMESNITRFHSSLKANGSRFHIRPHVSTHQCPHIAHIQAAAAGPENGIAVNTVGEAEVFAGAGFDDILISSPIAGRPKIARLCALAQSHRITVAVDSTGSIDVLSNAANAAGVILGILVEVDAGSRRSGVPMGEDAAVLAKHVSASHGLRLDGLMAAFPDRTGQRVLMEGCDAPSGGEGENKARLQELMETSKLVQQQAAQATVVSVTDSANYLISEVPGITEMQAGHYPLTDSAHFQVQPDCQPAARVLASVISHPTVGSAVLDAGHKSTGPDLGLPVLEGDPDAKAVRFSAEHGVLDLAESAQRRYMPGEKVWLVPFDLELSINQYDYIRAVRRGKLEGFWPIAARGRFS